MKNALLTTVAFLTLTAGTALAADVDYGPAPEEIDWGGLYIGAHAGYGWGNRDGCFTTDEECEEGDDFDYDQKGWLAGAQIGYNFMIAPSFLLGAEVDASLASIDGDLELEGILAEDKTGVGEYNWLASAKLRAGWAATDNFLLYATGGLALGGFDYEDQFGCEFTQSRDGWLAGGGAEVKISSRASIKAEYNFINLGDESQPCTAVILPVHTEADADLHVVKFGFNYLLGGQ
ncbi:MAG TPA: outer membrane beta-barrel protein [Aestuariivirgaceae bacterium]|nr:outer membrane beta-barrel protein [Aestuariivirgaceae bacterium]